MPKNRFLTFIVILLTISSTAGCAINSLTDRESAKKGSAAIINSDDYYQKLGLSRSQIEPWEDGMRTTGGKGSYEWWYFDATLNEGSTLVVVFQTKDSLRPDLPLEPRLMIEFTRADSTFLHRELKVKGRDFSAAKDHCEVRIGLNTFKGNLHDYILHLDADGVQADIKLHGTVPPWRPGTGYAFFKDKKEHFFAWLPSVPQGTVEGTMTIEGQSRQVTGVGYHDHNWGDLSLLKLLNNWYWGRARIGNYSVIAGYMITADQYGNIPLMVFMLARDGLIIADDFTKVKFSANRIYTDSLTHKPVAGVIVYDYDDGLNHYRITFQRERDLLRSRFVDKLHGIRYLLAKLVNLDGAYLRFTGNTTVERFNGDRIVETAVEKGGVWELIYFDHGTKP